MSDCIETTYIYSFLNDTYFKDNKDKIFALEGGSGAAKTWGTIDFVIEYCRVNSFDSKRLTIGRETYRDCIDTVAYDFFRRLKMIGAYEEHNHKKSHPQSYFLLGNQIDFTGWSNNGQPSKRQDLLWFNEVMESDHETFRQYNQRTNDVTILDYNPKYTDHWVYDKVIGRPDCFFLHTTLLDNPFLPAKQKKEILAYEPTEENIRNGTADDYLWAVYGLGKRAAPKGLIFKYVSYIDEFPDLAYHYGIDFGFTTDPTSITKIAETPTDIFLELLCYEPTETPEIIHEYSINKGINISLPTTADSSDKYTSENKGAVEMVNGLRSLGWNISKVSKTKSVMYWLLDMKKKKISIVKNGLYHHAKREQENYKLKEINGIEINQPIDKFNHFWDSARYGHMAMAQGNRNAFWN